MEEVKEAYEPSVVVCQCGADGLSEDPMASFNLTLEGIKRCVQQLIDWNLPLLLLGGGKYHEKCIFQFINAKFEEKIGYEMGLITA